VSDTSEVREVRDEEQSLRPRDVPALSDDGPIHISSPARRRWLLALFLLLLIAGAALRIGVNDVEEYAPDDEAVYLRTTAFLYQHGWSSYPRLVQQYLDQPAAWLYPHPMRWGHFALTTVACDVAGRCDARVLADLSTAAGILSILLIFLLGRDLLGDECAAVAAALAVTSPLQLAMGRRALQDEVFCASVLLTLWLAARVVRSAESSRRERLVLTIAAIASTTLMLGIKESAVLLYPALLAFVILLAPAPRRVFPLVAPLVVVPPVLYALITIAVSGGVRRCLALAHIVLTAGISSSTPFVQEFSSGPWHRPLFDLVILSPLVMLLAVVGAARSKDNHALRALSGFAIVVLISFGLLAIKNVRYVIPVDPVARLLAASAIVSIPRRRWIWFGIVAVIAVTELQLFHEVFIAGDVYDPVTQALLEALHAVPTVQSP
jgi:4-amino-4-deoxy-L-arabinose transferase-like glycosyltransferase